MKTRMPAAVFAACVQMDARLKTPVVVLSYTDPGTDAQSLQARVAPAFGANLFSLRIGGHELLAGGDDPAVLQSSDGGTPILFPTPNRVRDARFVFAGRRYEMLANHGKTFLHGLVRAKPFDFDQPCTSASSARVDTWIEWDERQDNFSWFPIRHRLQIRFALTRTGIRIAYQIQNHDRIGLPFGFGLHPWFRVPGRKDDVLIAVPARHRMEAVNLLPTGNLITVAGTPEDLCTPVPVAGLALDDVYFGVKPQTPATVEWRDLGVWLALAGSKEFGHMVVYTPDRPVFCLENQTCSTDAHNLFARGKKRASGLLVVPPAGKHGAFVNWALKVTEKAPPR